MEKYCLLQTLRASSATAHTSECPVHNFVAVSHSGTVRIHDRVGPIVPDSFIAGNIVLLVSSSRN